MVDDALPVRQVAVDRARTAADPGASSTCSPWWGSCLLGGRADRGVQVPQRLLHVAGGPREGGLDSGQGGLK